MLTIEIILGVDLTSPPIHRAVLYCLALRNEYLMNNEDAQILIQQPWNWMGTEAPKSYSCGSWCHSEGGTRRNWVRSIAWRAGRARLRRKRSDLRRKRTVRCSGRFFSFPGLWGIYHEEPLKKQLRAPQNLCNDVECSSTNCKSRWLVTSPNHRSPATERRKGSTNCEAFVVGRNKNTNSSSELVLYLFISGHDTRFLLFELLMRESALSMVSPRAPQAEMTNGTDLTAFSTSFAFQSENNY